MPQLAQAIRDARYDLDAFLQFLDRQDDNRWELVDGHPVMMAGGTLDHNTIALNIASGLRPAARKLGFRVHISDVLVINPENESFAAFPDVVVACGPEQGNERVLKHPDIVVEVLSLSTVIFDRGKKFDNYRDTPSIQQIFFVYQDQIRVEMWNRVDGGSADEPDEWIMTSLTELDAGAPFSRLGVTLTLNEIYLDAIPRAASNR